MTYREFRVGLPLKCFHIICQSESCSNISSKSKYSKKKINIRTNKGKPIMFEMKELNPLSILMDI